MKFNSNNDRQKKLSGQSMVELVCALIAAVPILLSVIDLGIIAMGASANDSVCREAANAAASGPPSSTVAPSTNQLSAGQSGFDLAVSVINVHQPTNLPAKVTDTPQVTETLEDVPPPDQGGAVDGEISVTTTVVITPPFLVGAYFGKSGIKLTSAHVVPFTYVVPKVVPPETN